MKHIKFIIPNALTLINLLAGSVAIVLIFEGFIKTSVYFLIVAAIADVLDGMTAKLLDATSEFGKQLDSLSDLVSFGFAPSALMYKMIYTSIVSSDSSFLLKSAQSGQIVMLFAAFLLAVFAALRLARFNIDTNTNSDFKGLPVPANALIVISIWLSANYSSNQFLKSLCSNELFLLIVIVLLSFLMISRIPMLSFKFKNSKFTENIWRYILIAGSFILFIIFGFDNLILIMIYYIMVSLVKSFFPKAAK